ncbi:MAG: redox-regulated ATPase YchF [Phycisphaeraceae bacterium]|nr:redox-regulated ATPase YchF [Phycisphaeraceae bacterium]
MKVALIGLIQSGKSTLLSSVSGRNIPPVGSTSIEEAIVPVPDGRLDWLTELYTPKKTTRATVDCMDVPGFNFADDSGRAASRRLINKIRTIDMLVLVIKGFDSDANPRQDVSNLQTELLLADLELVTTRIEKLEKQIRKPTKTQARDKAELALQIKLQDAIEAEKPISTAIETEAELDIIKSLGFLTLKPMFVAVNTDEAAIDEVPDLSDVLDSSVPVVGICAKLEHELAQLDAESRTEFMADLGITELAAGRFVNQCYSALGLISFLTSGPDEVRAWPIRKGTIAHDAAGKIHSDIKRGFIRAETFSFDALKEHGSEKELKAAGKIRLEGKEYVVQDGDVMNFRFNV